MSTTQPPPAPTSTVAPPSPTPNYNANASTLLFGFLVSALSIFAVFMSLAIVWNRLIARRHAVEAMMAMTPVPESPRLHRPKMWDIWIMPDKKLPPWLCINPVAAQKCDVDLPRTVQTERITPRWRRQVWNRLPPEITYLFYRPIPPAPAPFASHDTDTSHVELLHGSDIQVSLLIAMPRAQLSQGGMHEKRQSPHEIAFATADASYHDPASS